MIRHGFVRCESGEWINTRHLTGFMVEKMVDGKYAGYMETRYGRSWVTRECETEDEAQTALDNAMGWDEKA